MPRGTLWLAPWEGKTDDPDPEQPRKEKPDEKKQSPETHDNESEDEEAETDWEDEGGAIPEHDIGGEG